MKDYRSYIEVVEKMIDSLTWLSKLFTEMDKIIDQEKLFISSRSGKDFEKVLTAKQDCSSLIEKKVKKLSDYAFILQGKLGVTVSTVGELISTLSEVDFDKSMESKVLVHNIEKLKDSHKNLSAVRKKVNPKIEQNAYLIQTLLVRYREHLKCLRTAASSADALYTAEGSEKVNFGGSIFEVKA